MDNKYFEDEQNLLRIKKGDQILLKELHHQYWTYFCGYFLKRHQLSLEEVKDIYSDSFTTLYEKITNGTYAPPLKAAVRTYLTEIGKNKTKQFFQKKNRETNTESLENIIPVYQTPTIDQINEKRNQGNLIRNLLNQMEERCRELIQLTFIEENADDAIMNKMGFPSHEAVRNKRFNCLKKMRSLLQQ